MRQEVTAKSIIVYTSTTLNSIISISYGVSKSLIYISIYTIFLNNLSSKIEKMFYNINRGKTEH